MKIRHPNRLGGRLRKLFSIKWKPKWGLEPWCYICVKNANGKFASYVHKLKKYGEADGI